MGWVESPAYFCAASETGQDVAADYARGPVGTLPAHKFLELSRGSEEYSHLPDNGVSDDLRYVIDVFVDDCIGLAIPTSQSQLDHVANSIMMGMHEVFPPAEEAERDPIAYKN